MENDLSKDLIQMKITVEKYETIILRTEYYLRCLEDLNRFAKFLDLLQNFLG